MSSDSTCPSPSVKSPDTFITTPSDGPLSAARNIVSIPRSNSDNGALSKIEDLLESIIDALDTGSELVIPFRRPRPDAASQTQDLSQQRDARQVEVVRFPGRNVQEAKKFGEKILKEDILLVCLHSGTITIIRSSFSYH